MKKAIRVVCFAVLLGLCILGSYRVLSWKDTMGDIGSSVTQLAYTEDNKIDVAFVGSSHVFAGIHPRTFWNEFGLATFDMSISSMDMDSAYYYTKNMLKTQSPKYVFVELYSFTFDEHKVTGNLYRNMLSMPMSKNAVDLVNAYYADDKNSAKDFLLRFPIIHTRYKELTLHDFKDLGTAQYGRGERYVLGDGGTIDLSETTTAEVAELDEKRIKWLHDFKQLSEEYNFKLAFFIAPYSATEDEQKYINAAGKFCKDNGIEFYDFNKMTDELGIDLKADSSDALHLNDKGAEKLSRWIGTYLTYEVGIPARYGQDGYEMWDKDAAYLDHVNSLNFLAMCYNLGEWDGFFRTLNSIPGISYIISVENDWREVSNPMDVFMGKLGVSPEELGDGGIWVKVQGGDLQKVADAYDMEIHYIDLDDFYTARIARAEADNLSSIMIGNVSGTVDKGGMNIMVYDNTKFEVNNMWNLK